VFAEEIVQRIIATSRAYCDGDAVRLLLLGTTAPGAHHLDARA
jgi:hypothetical protein